MNARGLKRISLGLPNDPLTLGGTTAQLLGDVHHQRILLLGNSAGDAIKLPASKGSGTVMQFIVSVVCTSSPFYVISTNPSTDIFQGSVGINLTGSTATWFQTASNSNTITINGTTQGGVTIGDTFFVADIAAGTWAVWGALIGSGSVATVFSHV